MIGFWLKRSWYESYFSHSGIWSGQFVLPPTANKPNADLMLNFNWQKILFMTHVCPHTLYWVVNQPVKVNWANQLLQSWYIRKKRYFLLWYVPTFIAFFALMRDPLVICTIMLSLYSIKFALVMWHSCQSISLSVYPSITCLSFLCFCLSGLLTGLGPIPYSFFLCNLQSNGHKFKGEFWT